ncbi:lytic transglycosylase domain-containing protein [Rhodovulum marinum]|uniref:Transglycosylase-like protein with SLT domain n=1 Tax=Rhodovulum marinum TaxID=320662 RepID=A0A4R2PUK0_9RHOB|nr:lytic transglycosylase domain-containing protein [Rhodovulum marinum]TCP39599.1 transglycosylase-like protein with SLT domain [Rhodovulum marinum]
MPLSSLSGRIPGVAALVLLLLPGAPYPGTAGAEARTPGRQENAQSVATAVHPLDRHIAEAAARFGLPAPWIRAVIAVESAGDPRAVSRAGAMGLMQVMPGTWAELRTAHGLGDDPFDARDNILAGTAYLRRMVDRFGVPGAFAAYNAGPGRYGEHLATGRPLPRETRAYVARLARRIGPSAASPAPSEGVPDPRDWRAAPLFVVRGAPAGRSPRRASVQGRAGPRIAPPPTAPGTAPGLFVTIEQEDQP